ncbi:MAG: MBL fold metallo-hydrolase [Actinomycetota bacterium]|nr:MBL fold metallo-hydrolase [Actinomycetota bacterium]
MEYGRNKPLNYRIIEPEKKFSIKDISVVAYRVIHSLRCPAVCFRLRGEKTIVYAPDIVDTEIDKSIVFKGVDTLIADGSSLNINMVRRRDGKIFGHTRAKTVINWCKKYGIENLILTHFGKQIVTMDLTELEQKLGQYSENKVRVEAAFDGFKKNI